ncbi:Gfo/Idh/MocA family protein [Paramicrobacterium agarici]|uniref:Gfo/Idh/MocA family protein n=1 Tax=Paramicrobacterium agarici TaxID=630514 RepID=UPI0011532F10|nr:Gfo/Idh/MocA family oxidoreductase [Microbacterium agarici]TQO23880.1 putative dehydrogenase [Microbacterium agarici]
MTRLRIGVLGAAEIAPRALIEPARDNADTEVVAVAARDIDRARSYAAEHAIPRAFGSYDELLSDDNIDAVYVPAPNGLHGRWTLASIAARKHVLCEKPFAANADEARRVAAVAADSGLVVMEAFHNLYHPVTPFMTDVISSGELGGIRSIDADFSFSIVDQSDNVRWSRELAGGSLMDVGCYPLRLLRALGTGEPRVVSATATEFTPDVDGSMLISLEFPDGATGTASCSMTREPSMSATITGERGTLVSSHPFLPHEGNEFTITTTEGTRVASVTNESTYAFQLRAFVDAVRSGTPVVSDAQDAVATMSLIDDAYRAAGLPLRQPTRA